MRSVLAYSTARVLLFLVTAGVLYLLGARKLLLLALAVLISGLISFVLLARQRDAMSSKVASTVEEKRRRFEEARSKEDPK
jgi:Mn2+/Fe2+ NRAMP family transporter